jgi:hypothetical protein
VDEVRGRCGQGLKNTYKYTGWIKDAKTKAEVYQKMTSLDFVRVRIGVEVDDDVAVVFVKRVEMIQMIWKKNKGLLLRSL